MGIKRFLFLSKRRYENLKQQHDHDDGIKYGGTLLVKKDTSKHITIEKAIHDRHSIRDFKAGEVSLEALKKAIELDFTENQNGTFC